MGRGVFGVGLISLTIFLSSCVATQTQVKEAKEPEATLEMKAKPYREEVKTGVPIPVPVEPSVPETPQAVEPSAPAVKAPDRKSVV